MHHAQRAVTGALAAAALGAAPAAAAPPWTAPTPVGTDATATTAPAVAVGGSGDALVAWTRPCGPGADRCSPRRFPGVQLASGRPGGRFDVFRTVGGELADAPVAYGSTRAIVLRHKIGRSRGAQRPPTRRLTVSYARVDGRIEPERVLDEYVDGGGAAIAANARGEVVVAWIENAGGRDLLWMAERRPGRPFGARRVIRSGSRMSDVDVGFGDNGDLVVAYRRADTLEARWRRGSRPLDGPQALGETDDVTSVSTAVAKTGRMVVAWGRQDGGIEANEPYVVQAAVRPAGPARFRAATTVEPGGPELRPEGGVHAAMAPDGRGVVAWTAVQRTGGRQTFPVRVASVTADARVTPGGEQVADSGRIGDVVMADDGAATVLWTALGGPEGFSPGPVRAAVQPPGVLRFGAPEDVSARLTAGPAGGALDPQGRPVAVWAQLGSPPDVPSPNPEGTVHAAMRGG